jgi:hypothetical protein
LKRRGRIVAGAIALGALGFGLATGCQYVAGLDGDYTKQEVCQPLHAPERPPQLPLGAPAPTFTVAMHTIDLDEQDAEPRFGIDLDGRCSCTLDQQSCAPPDPKKAICDDAHGLDNGAGVAFSRLATLSAGAVSSSVLNAGLKTGLWSLLFQISKYTDGADDDAVTVQVFETTGTPSPPLWDGSDLWPISCTSLQGMAPTQPLVQDDKAYVRGGVLVAHFESLGLPTRGKGVRLDVRLSNVTLTAKLEKDAKSRFMLREGTIAGTWTQPEMFASLSSLRYNDKSKLCRDDGAYFAVKGTMCEVLDLHVVSPSGADGGGMGGAGGAGGADPCGSEKGAVMGAGEIHSDEALPCNAISFGIGFTADPAQLSGTVAAPAPPDNPCAPENDPKGDSCP